MAKKTKRRVQPELYIIISICLLLGGLAAFLSIFLLGNTTSTTTKENSSVASAVVCKTKQNVDGFFDVGHTTNFDHEIKVLHQNDKPKSISYTYTGNYATEEEANAQSAKFNASYNKYVGANSISPRLLSPTFTSHDNTAQISLYVDIEKLTPLVMDFFFMTSEDYDGVSNISSETFSKKFEEKGFKCNYN